MTMSCNFVPMSLSLSLSSSLSLFSIPFVGAYNLANGFYANTIFSSWHHLFSLSLYFLYYVFGHRVTGTMGQLHWNSVSLCNGPRCTRNKWTKLSSSGDSESGCKGEKNEEGHFTSHTIQSDLYFKSQGLKNITKWHCGVIYFESYKKNNTTRSVQLNPSLTDPLCLSLFLPLFSPSLFRLSHLMMQLAQLKLATVFLNLFLVIVLCRESFQSLISLYKEDKLHLAVSPSEK